MDIDYVMEKLVGGFGSLILFVLSLKVALHAGFESKLLCLNFLFFKIEIK